MNDQDQDHESKFKLIKAVDPDLPKILGARMDVLTDCDLNDGARSLFCLLLDLALDPSLNLGRRGQILISTNQIHERLGRSARAIYGWVKQLVWKGHIWVSKQPRPNTEPINVYHVTKLQPIRQPGLEMANDGLWGNGYRRPEGTMPRGARSTPCRKRHILLDQFGNPLFAQLPQYQHASGKKVTSLPQSLREAPAQNDTCQQQSLREPTAQNDTCQPQSLPLPPAQNDTTPPQKPAVLKETEKGTSKRSIGGEPPKPPAPRSMLDIKDRLAAVEREIKALKADEGNYSQILAKSVAETVAWLRDPANAKDESDRAKKLQEAQSRERNPRNLTKGPMRTEIRARLGSLAQQRQTLERSLAGLER